MLRFIYFALKGKLFSHSFKEIPTTVTTKGLVIAIAINWLQRRDDDVPIYLVKPIREIRESFNLRLKEMAKETSIS